MSGLHQLLHERRAELIERWTQSVRTTLGAEGVTTTELKDRIPSFIDELTCALHPSAVALPGASTVAREHGVQRLRLGFDISEVVREYGLLCDCILALAGEASVLPAVDELRLLNRCISDGVAEAGSEYVGQRDRELQRRSDEHIGFIAHELRNPLSSARMSFALLRKREAMTGRAVAALDRSLKRMGDLVDNALTSAWLKAGGALQPEPVELTAFLRELIEDTSAEAEGRETRIVLDAPEPIEIEADRRLLISAISNTLRNAVKFSRDRATVVVRARAADGRVRVEVEDECGGLPPGKIDQLLNPFVQAGRDRGGFGLGLAIARQAAAAHNGTVQIEDRPKKGCVVRLDLPRVQPRA